MSRELFREYRVMWMPLGYAWQSPRVDAPRCCATMRAALKHDCDLHDDPFDCPDTVLVYHEPFDEYGLPIRDGGQSYLLITHCPWCGTDLPPSQRDRWFDAVEAAGFDLDDPDGIPERFLSAAWREGAAGGPS